MKKQQDCRRAVFESGRTDGCFESVRFTKAGTALEACERCREIPDSAQEWFRGI